MTDNAERLRNAFRVSREDFQLTRRQQNRLVFTWILPFIVISAMFTQSSLEFVFGDNIRFGGGAFEGSHIPEFWARMYVLAQTIVGFGFILCVAMLFFIGLTGMSRAEGAWHLAVASGLVLLCAAFGLLHAGILIYHSPNTYLDDLNDWHPYTWLSWSLNFGFLAIGFAFLAYCGLSSRPATAVRRFRRRA